MKSDEEYRQVDMAVGNQLALRFAHALRNIVSVEWAVNRDGSSLKAIFDTETDATNVSEKLNAYNVGNHVLMNDGKYVVKTWMQPIPQGWYEEEYR